MSRKDTLADFLSGHDTPEPSAAENADETPKPRTGAGSVKTLSSSLRLLNADAQRARILQEQISEGSRVVELDPGLLDNSFISDRISATGDPDFNALLESIKTNGQLVPILVRPNSGPLDNVSATVVELVEVGAWNRDDVPAGAGMTEWLLRK